jgi:predicted dehydrogenase
VPPFARRCSTPTATRAGTADRGVIRVALAGYGLAGRFFHGPLLRALPGFELTAIVTNDAERRAQASADFPAARLLAHADELWPHAAGFDLVVIATATGSHAPYAAAAIDARIAAVVDKPLATTAAEGTALLERASIAGVPLIPFQNRRWDSDFLTCRRLIEAQALGGVQRFESRFERWKPSPNRSAWRETLPPEAGGGVLLDIGIHLVDQALALFGPVTRTYAETAARRGGADDDVFLALQHASGPISQLWASAVTAAPGPRLRVLGSAGAYVHEHLDPQEAALRAGASPLEPGFGVPPPQQWGQVVRGAQRQSVRPEPGRWLAFYEGVERCLRDGAPPPVSAADAVTALRILDDARRAI